MTFLLHLRRNISRNGGRSLGVVLVVGLTLGIFLVLGQVSTSITAYTNEVVASVPNILTVQNAGGSIGGGKVLITTGGQSGANLSSVVSKVSSTPDVSSVQRVFISNPTLGGGVGAPGTSSCQVGNQIAGEDTTSPIKLFFGQASGAATPVMNSGRDLLPSDQNSSNVIIGQQYATDNHLYVGDELIISGHTFNIVGIFAGNGCAGDFVIIPYPTGSATTGVTNPIILYAYVNSYQNVNSVYFSLQNSLGSSYAVEDLANADHNALASAISSILLSSQFGEYAALIAGAAVMVVVMVLVTSQRTREIGILKALGFGNGRILGLVLLEALVLSLIGLPLALGFILLFGPLIAQSLLSNLGGGGPTGGNSPSGGNFTRISSSQGGSNPFLQNVHFSLTWETILLGAIITISFGLLGAFYPAIKAILLRPADAVRRE